jgi:hypothetical protein
VHCKLRNVNHFAVISSPPQLKLFSLQFKNKVDTYLACFYIIKYLFAYISECLTNKKKKKRIRQPLNIATSETIFIWLLVTKTLHHTWAIPLFFLVTIFIFHWFTSLLQAELVAFPERNYGSTILVSIFCAGKMGNAN